jgi:hypothetical protein
VKAMQVRYFVAILLLILSAEAFAEWPDSRNTRALALLDSLQVGEIDLELATDSEMARKQLWDLYANQELSKRYAQVEVPGGASVWPVFRSRLVATAKTNNFESALLEKVLHIIEQQEPHLTTKGQLIPFGAFLAHRSGEAVWVVPCNWASGYRPPKDGVPIPMTVSHIRVWAFLAKNGEQVGYSTCK